MKQLKESQIKILNDLADDDFFNIITFSSDVHVSIFSVIKHPASVS